jgi:hypothetical protein
VEGFVATALSIPGTQMTKRRTPRRSRTSNPVPSTGDLEQMLEVLFAFDRSVLEFSMSLYDVPSSDQDILREQNRRLHRLSEKGCPGFWSRLKVGSSLIASIETSTQALEWRLECAWTGETPLPPSKARS